MVLTLLTRYSLLRAILFSCPTEELLRNFNVFLTKEKVSIFHILWSQQVSDQLNISSSVTVYSIFLCMFHCSLCFVFLLLLFLCYFSFLDCYFFFFGIRSNFNKLKTADHERGLACRQCRVHVVHG